MIHNKKPFTCLLLLTLVSLFCLKTKADPVYLFHNCTNTSTFIPNSLYQTNLNHLLSSLSSNSTTNEFSTVTTGQGPSTVYGLFLCRGDVGAKVCQDCVNFATKDILKRCPGDKEAIIWYDECFLRFSNRSFFGTVDERPRFALLNTGNVTDQTRNFFFFLATTEQSRFNQTLLATMNETATEAAKTGVGEKKYATKHANFTAFQPLYTLVQCTPDLSGENCSRCLGDAIGRLPICCNGKKGGRVVFASCYVRYELYPFYNEIAIAPSPPPINKGHKKKSSVIIVAIVVPIVIVVVLFSIGFKYLRRRSKKKCNFILQDNVEGEMTNIESLQYDFHTIEASTTNFSDDSKIGQGGFGVVYKGTLPNGEKIAAKRLLLGSSEQGANEFKNEVALLAKLQHRNLVRLLGFCLEGEEKILIYEYAPNKSLDYYLFDHEKQRELDWERRHKIIGGIARGILYLHEDSRLKIIHRDLKASNVLLDADMNPKVSDFGMAKVFVVDQTQGCSSRIVGTYGYMSPEYAMHGQFSIKSDVFSFGVLVLEILSGKKNNCFYQSHGSGDLLSFAWEHWRKGTPLELLDPSLGSSYSRNEVMKCIHIGLLCVQENPASRPTMATIVSMLDNYSITLPLPQQPTFFSRNREQTNTETSKSISCSVNDESMITELHPR